MSPVGNTGGASGAACGGGAAGGGGKGADYNQLSSWGCFAYCKCKTNNDSHGETGAFSGAAKGGVGGGIGASGCACDDGNPWKDAADGPPGSAGLAGACGGNGAVANANVWGSFKDGNWAKTDRGGTGDSGSVGAGGGGGGSGGFGVNVGWGGPDNHNGDPAGGGGGGGCGGNGGEGGQQGGVSVPVLLFQSAVKMDQQSDAGDCRVPDAVAWLLEKEALAALADLAVRGLS